MHQCNPGQSLVLYFLYERTRYIYIINVDVGVITPLRLTSHVTLASDRATCSCCCLIIFFGAYFRCLTCLVFLKLSMICHSLKLVHVSGRGESPRWLLPVNHTHTLHTHVHVHTWIPYMHIHREVHFVCWLRSLDPTKCLLFCSYNDWYIHRIHTSHSIVQVHDMFSRSRSVVSVSLPLDIDIDLASWLTRFVITRVVRVGCCCCSRN